MFKVSLTFQLLYQDEIQKHFKYWHKLIESQGQYFGDK